MSKVITEVASGINDVLKQWLSLLQDRSIRLIVVEHNDRFTRFGFHGYSTILQDEGRDIDLVNEADNGKEDFLQDLVSIITSFSQGFMDRGDARERQRESSKVITHE